MTDDNKIKDAYSEGYQCYLDDGWPSDNPYCTTTEENCWEAWDAGYNQAGLDD